ncbi:MAG: NAD(P)H-dependent flavin oxidoreductase [Magnetovibrionaceae bacterium]
MKPLNALTISGQEVLPIVEGGKGVAVSDGLSAGAFAAAGAVGTFSGTNPDSYDENGDVIRQIYSGKTRRERFEELVTYAIDGAVAQAQRAYETSNGNGRLHLNVLWEAGGTERVLAGVIERAKGLFHGITCGAGMPYKMGEIAANAGLYYYPIVSSARAFNALWRRAYSKTSEWMGGVVYEDPWLAGGHNGLSNSEDPKVPQPPYERVVELRRTMNKYGLQQTPIFMAGGVWFLRDWADWIDNPEVGPIAFQYGTRPLLTRESPVSEEWQRRLLEIEEGDILLHRFSPTGFFSSGVRNAFLRELEGRTERQIAYSKEPVGEHTEALPIGTRGREVFVTPGDKQHAEDWVAAGHTEAMRTPDNTLIFVSKDRQKQILTDQKNCMGCLSQCRFSNWATNEDFTTGRPADPRSFCIQKTLQDIAHGGSLDDNLMFSGHNAFKFQQDPFYSNGFVPTVQQLVDRICTGD